MLEPTPLYGGNAAFLDALYEQYLLDPASVDERWREYFAQLAPAGAERAHGPIRAEIAGRAPRGRGAAMPAATAGAHGPQGGGLLGIARGVKRADPSADDAAPALIQA